LGFKGPRKMSVALPGLTNDNQIIPMRANGVSHALVSSFVSSMCSLQQSESLVDRARHRNMDNLIALQNKTPTWNEGNSPSERVSFLTRAMLSYWQILNRTCLTFTGV
jgi:tubby and related proteins